MRITKHEEIINQLKYLSKADSRISLIAKSISSTAQKWCSKIYRIGKKYYYCWDTVINFFDQFLLRCKISPHQVEIGSDIFF